MELMVRRRLVVGSYDHSGMVEEFAVRCNTEAGLSILHGMVKGTYDHQGSVPDKVGVSYSRRSGMVLCDHHETTTEMDISSATLGAVYTRPVDSAPDGAYHMAVSMLAPVSAQATSCSSPGKLGCS